MRYTLSCIPHIIIKLRDDGMNEFESILRCLLDNLEEGIQIVDSSGITKYYNKSMADVEGLKPEDVIGKKVTEYLKGVEEESSTLMNALKNSKKYVDVIQHYSSKIGKNITTINTTIPVIFENKKIAAIEISKDMTRLKELNEKICKLQNVDSAKSKYYSFEDILGNSEYMKKAINVGIKASLSNSSVLIYGETGCGKELFAQSIFSDGLRKNKPFIPINCAAIPGALLEGMLFGTEKGSFTGAENKKGLFEEAKGGTILLDEINSMEPALQSKLLRVLQDGYIRPLGSSKIIDVDVRIIATLNEDPEKLIEHGKLRKDFYYRLSVLRINIPPLRERKEDISLLSDKFLSYYNKILGKNIRGFGPDVIDAFNKYDWPGNVRELENIIESAIIMADEDDILRKEYFDSRIFGNKIPQVTSNLNQHMPQNISLEKYIEDIEKDVISKALTANKQNITKTASYLKISRQNLQYKIRKYNL
jgi:arginine utilization regulatory protein